MIVSMVNFGVPNRHLAFPKNVFLLTWGASLAWVSLVRAKDSGVRGHNLIDSGWCVGPKLKHVPNIAQLWCVDHVRSHIVLVMIYLFESARMDLQKQVIGKKSCATTNFLHESGFCSFQNHFLICLGYPMYLFENFSDRCVPS